MEIYHGTNEYDTKSNSNIISIVPKSKGNLMASVEFKNNWFTGYGRTDEEAIAKMVANAEEHYDEEQQFLQKLKGQHG